METNMKQHIFDVQHEKEFSCLIDVTDTDLYNTVKTIFSRNCAILNVYEIRTQSQSQSQMDGTHVIAIKSNHFLSSFSFASVFFFFFISFCFGSILGFVQSQNWNSCFMLSLLFSCSTVYLFMAFSKYINGFGSNQTKPNNGQSIKLIHYFQQLLGKCHYIYGKLHSFHSFIYSFHLVIPYMFRHFV